MKYARVLVFPVVAIVLLSGCFYAHIKQPLDTDVDKTVFGPKTGMATSYSVLWVAAWGDAGTAAAANNGSIKTVNHMDRELYSVFFGVYTKVTTIVYGD
jgi:hypothetical protein